ncbi:hypothetical protein V498_02571, partial [Pseudogymnoascus sp. VKM F-4517 (FW-2822)]
MKERFRSVAPMLGFECPVQNRIVLETEDLCDDCAVQIKITAGQALAMFREMNNAQVDVVRQKLKNGKRKKRSSRSRKDDPGYLSVPAWDTKISQRKNRQRSRSGGPYKKRSRQKTSEQASQHIGQRTSQNTTHKKIRRHSLTTIDHHDSSEEIRADLYVPRSNTSASDAKPAVGHEQNVESL